MIASYICILLLIHTDKIGNSEFRTCFSLNMPEQSKLWDCRPQESLKNICCEIFETMEDIC